MKYELDRLAIIHYPDPRLRTPCETVTQFDQDLADLAARMLALMKGAKGVGLAAPQVGLLLRVFVMNPTGEEADAMAFVNPVIREPRGAAEAEEGCLSIPGVNAQIRRAAHCRIMAQNLKGEPVELEGQDLLCRIWQHETDHLNGVLILDRMGPGDKLATRKTLQALETSYKAKAKKA